MQASGVATAADIANGLRSWLQVVKAYQTCYSVLSQELKPLDLSVAQHDVLTALHYEDGLSQQRLAEKLLVVKSNVTALLTRLEKRELIRREVDAQDARVKRVYLSSEGQALVERSLEVQCRVVRRMMSALNKGEVAQLEDMMRRVRGVLHKS